MEEKIEEYLYEKFPKSYIKVKYKNIRQYAIQVDRNYIVFKWFNNLTDSANLESIRSIFEKLRGVKK